MNLLQNFPFGTLRVMNCLVWNSPVYESVNNILEGHFNKINVRHQEQESDKMNSGTKS